LLTLAKAVIVLSMDLEKKLPHVDQVLTTWQRALGDDQPAYRNHVYRVAYLTAAQSIPNPEEWQQIEIAAAFHDLAIWSHGTFDYLEPSVALAEEYLQEIKRSEWGEVIGRMIRQHHKVTACRRRGGRSGMALEEAFRRADWIDVTLGRRRFGVEKQVIRQLHRVFPNCGFHRRLGQLTWRQFRRSPWNPLPMFKW
jgi:hypothetical protein